MLIHQFGGYDDEEFEEWTVPFFEQAREGKFTIILSDVTVKELLYALNEFGN